MKNIQLYLDLELPQCDKFYKFYQVMVFVTLMKGNFVTVVYVLSMNTKNKSKSYSVHMTYGFETTKFSCTLHQTLPVVF